MEISVFLVTFILFGLIFVFLFSGVWIGVALGVVGFIGLSVFLHGKDVVIPAVSFGIMSSYTLAAAPLFIFMGEIIVHGGLNKKLYTGVSKWMGVIPGGLVQCNIVSCAIFAAVCGSSAATALTIGSVAYPEQTQRGYDTRIVLEIWPKAPFCEA